MFILKRGGFMDKLQVANDLLNTLQDSECDECIIFDNCRAAMISGEAEGTICNTLKEKILYGV